MTRVMPLVTTIISLGLLLVSGCGRQSRVTEDATPRPPSHEEPHAPDETGASGEHLRLSADLLRDLRLTTAEAALRSDQQRVDALGELHANQEAYAEVHAPLSGRVVRLLAAPGARVRAGSGLAVIQSAELARARAAYLSASARRVLAEQTLARRRGLLAERIVPVRDVQQAEADAAAAVAEVRAARATLSALGASAEDQAGESSLFTLRAPVGGVVLSRRVVLGQMTDMTTPAFTLADLSTMWLTVHVFERDALRVEPRAAARVTFTALPGRVFEGRVTYLGREVEASSGTIPIRIAIQNEPSAAGRAELLLPGMTASAALHLGDDSVATLSVPAPSVHRLGDAWVVFVPRGEGLFEIRRVGRGRDLSGAVEILNGLRAGERVVVEGAFVLKAEAEKARGGDARHDH